MDEQIATSTDVTDNGPFSFENVPQGQYTLGVVGVPADKDVEVADVADALQKGRYAIAFVKVIPGQTASVELALP